MWGFLDPCRYIFSTLERNHYNSTILKLAIIVFGFPQKKLENTYGDYLEAKKNLENTYGDYLGSVQTYTNTYTSLHLLPMSLMHGPTCHLLLPLLIFPC